MHQRGGCHLLNYSTSTASNLEVAVRILIQEADCLSVIRPCAVAYAASGKPALMFGYYPAKVQLHSQVSRAVLRQLGWDRFATRTS